MSASDPAPRSYPPFVSLQRRSARGASSAPARTDFDAIETWLLGDAATEDDLLTFYESLVWRLVAAGLPLHRTSLHVGTLHPQLFGFAWNWSRTDGLCDEVRVTEQALRADSYRRNPLFAVIERGESFRGRTDDSETIARHPLMAELAQQGIVEYLALPLRTGGSYHNAATAATRQAGGFTATQLAGLQRILRLFALHVERHIVRRIAVNVLDTYLGTAAGGRVLEGRIKRGAGESISAVVWASDLRGFTDLSEKLGGPDMIALLNVYFEVMAGAVLDHGGEVLKFIGDGLLAAFPFSRFRDETTAAQAAVTAAEQALAGIARLNADPPPELASVKDWRPLGSGIALHEGDVFFGNVGAPERLDFTVIGPAVNAVSRVEALTKALGRPILITASVAQRLDRPLDALGSHALRGVQAPIELFAPAR